MVATRKSAILGPDGLPIEVQMLSGQLAEPQLYGPRGLAVDVQAPGLTPERLGAILRAANHGHAREYLTLAFDMEERYLHYAAQLNTRKLAIDGVSVTVTNPKGANPKAVDFVESIVNSPGFGDMLQDLLDGVGKGYSVIEPVWEYQDNALRPIDLQWRDPRYFRYDPIGLRKLHMLDDAGMCGLELKPPYFIVHEPKIRTGPQIRAGLARSAAWAFMVQQFTLQDWSAFAEVYGQPLRVGKYGRSATAEDQRTLLRAVRAIGSDAAAIIPKDMEIEFHQLNGTQGANVYGQLVAYTDKKVSMVVIGQTMTAEDGSSLGQAKVHNEVRHDIRKADARQITTTLNEKLIRHAVAMNFGPQEVYPKALLQIEEPEDIKAVADAIGVAVPLGLKVGQATIRKKFGIPDPQPDEELLTPPAAAKPKAIQDMPPPSEQLASRLHQRCTCSHCQSQPEHLAADPPEEPDLTDEMMDEELKDWQKITDPLLETLFAEMVDAGSYEEALKRLDRLRLDTRPLQERLARATAKSRGMGDTGDE